MTAFARRTGRPSTQRSPSWSATRRRGSAATHAAETTGRFIAAKFEHDTARPVDGYAAPQLHTHAVVFNITEREDGTTRALQPRGLFETQQFATAVYQVASHLSASRTGL